MNASGSSSMVRIFTNALIKYRLRQKLKRQNAKTAKFFGLYSAQSSHLAQIPRLKLLAMVWSALGDWSEITDNLLKS